MNQESWAPGRHDNVQGSGQYGGPQGQKGSVTPARQRAWGEEIGLVSEQTPGPIELEGVEVTSLGNPIYRPRLETGDFPIQHPSPEPSPPLPPPNAGNASREPPPFVAPISRPASSTQWPLREDNSAPTVTDNGPMGERGIGRGAPPQRPPRPSYSPPLLDPLMVEENAPAVQIPQPQNKSGEMQQHTPTQPPRYWENNFQAASSRESGSLRTALGSPTSFSRPSTSSSVGTIPDFPSPVISLPSVPQTRRGAHLGPPPSARRGASSYYSQSSYVTPIPEEIPETGHGSFASSHVIPTSWGDGSTEFYLGLDEDEEDEEGELPDKQIGASSRSGELDDGNELLRSASLGKRQKPSLTTIGCPDPSQRKAVQDGANKLRAGSQTAVAARNAGGATTPTLVSPLEEKHNLGDTHEGTFLEPPYEDPAQKFPNALAKETNTSTQRARTPVSAYADPRMDQILGSFEKGSTLHSSGSSSPFTLTTPPMNGKTEPRRPPPLNLGPTRDADVRGSLTSLPDLIRRATKLASNLDRGKTASRLGMWDMFHNGEGTEKGGSCKFLYHIGICHLHTTKSLSAVARRGSGSLSDMLASFPPPGLSTPVGAEPRSRWTSTFNNSNLAFGQSSFPPDSTSGRNTKSSERQLCGMRRWIFLLLCMLVFLLIAAAVILPVTLTILPRRHTPATLASCQKILPCENGGTSVISMNTCRCVCANLFTGPTCAVAGENGCVTTNIGSFENVTIGSGIPNLLSSSQSNFSIALDPSKLLVLFSYTNMSCTWENALVTFNGVYSRRSIPLHESNLIVPIQASSSSPPLTTSRPVLPRAATSSTADTNLISGAITSSGILLAAPPATQATPAPSTTATATSSAASSAPSSSSNSIPITNVVLNFARVAVLFIFQETDLSTAATAQGKLQSQLMGSTLTETSVTTGSIVVHFGNYSVALGNGQG